jgi:hypothetical protein
MADNGTTTAEDFLGGLFDRGLQVFDRVADFELGRRELDLAGEYAMLERQMNQANAPSTTPPTWSDPFAGAAGARPSMFTWIAGGAAALAIGVGIYAIAKN